MDRGTESAASDPAHSQNNRFWALALGTVGVVFGDIGTSPLYAMREALIHARRAASRREAVLGVISLMLWALILIVTVKYVLFLMRADNNGEGGTLSLMALAQRAPRAAAAVDVLPGRGRRGAVLRRRDHHAGDLGAVGGRGAAQPSRRGRSTPYVHA